MKADNEIRQALCRELEEAHYDASLAARRYEVVDPTKRLVARELETRWNTALERVAHRLQPDPADLRRLGYLRAAGYGDSF